jgi:SAM-dependent methyltransferase
VTRPATTPEYDESFIERLEMMWGKGYLSPGGAEEVRIILAGESLSGKRVLDIGCGAGGAELLLVREYDAANVVGIDIIPQLVERARQLSEEAGLARRIQIKAVEPGRLPFKRAAFDVVFTKDSLLHVPDKLEIFREIYRVLRPGGFFIGSDWLAGENVDRCPSWARFRELRRPSFAMASGAIMAQAMRDAQFEHITLIDRNAWFAEAAARDVETVEGPLRNDLRLLLGEAGYEDWVAVRRAIAGAALSGALRPTHIKAFKPS